MPDKICPCVSIPSSYSSSQRMFQHKTGPFQDRPNFPMLLTVQATVPTDFNQQATIHCSKLWSSEPCVSPCVSPSLSYTNSLSLCVSTTPPYTSSLTLCIEVSTILKLLFPLRPNNSPVVYLQSLLSTILLQ